MPAAERRQLSHPIASVLDGPSRLHYLDTLRFLACSAVVMQHLLEKVDPRRFDPFLRHGPGIYGVVLFFFLSGMSMPLSVRSEPPLSTFLVRRVFRIFPAYLALLLLLRLFAIAGVPEWRITFANQTFGDLLSNFLLIQEWTGSPALLGITWTLSLEFVWYGIFAFVHYGLGDRKGWAFTNLYSLLLLTLALLSFCFERRLPLGRAAMIGAALIGYLMARWQAGQLPNARFAASLAAFIVSMIVAQFVSFGHFKHPTTSLASSLVAWTGATATFLLFSIPKSLRDGRIARLRTIVFLGEISYSLYLTHGVVMGLWFHALEGNAMLVVAPITTIAISWLMFERIEKPAVKLGRGLESRARPLVARAHGRALQPKPQTDLAERSEAQSDERRRVPAP